MEKLFGRALAGFNRSATAKNHVTAILKTLNVTNRTEAVIAASHLEDPVSERPVPVPPEPVAFTDA
jgi:hypothetical protein